MSKTADLLIEIGCEELPAKLLKNIQDTFVANIKKALHLADLAFNEEETKGFATPRRLALLVKDLETAQAAREVLKRGPAKNAAFDEKGNPTKAALGFAESCGVSMDELSFQETDKGTWLSFKQQTTGKTTAELIPPLLLDVLNKLPVGRRMRWGDNNYTFSRPIHWIVLLHGKQIIETEMFGIKSGNKTRGHRFHHPDFLTISSPEDYEAVLERKGFVITDFNKRRDTIVSGINNLTKQHKNIALLSEELLNEVTGLVEWPVTLLGEFSPNFLKVPREALITSMQTHQKCFAVTDHKETLLPLFLIISNIQSKKPNSVKAGNEWVMQARLADAVFFYQQDKEVPLHNRCEDLKKVVFQAGLGTLFDKSKRIAQLSKTIAKKVGIDTILIERAALLCKTDLLTQMVGEFPELQGIMGRYYALHDSEPESVAYAIEEHYHPRFAEDSLPASLEGCVLALSDRIDTLVGLFALGNRPTGDKDPFAMRRQALAVLRILVEKELDLDLKLLLETAKDHYGTLAEKSDLIQPILDFCFERSRAWYLEQGIFPQVFEAVLAKNPTNPLDFERRISAVNHFIKLPEAEALAAANKRVQNILLKSEITIPQDPTVDKTLLQENEEKELLKHLEKSEKMVEPLLMQSDYREALITLAALREPIDEFFNKVMVMAEDKEIRNNRLRLLNRLRALFLRIADISLL